MSNNFLTDTQSFSAADCGVVSGAEGGNSSAVSGSEGFFRNIQVESSPPNIEKVSNYRRLEWKKLQKMQAIFPEISSQIRKMGRADYLADDKKKGQI